VELKYSSLSQSLCTTITVMSNKGYGYTETGRLSGTLKPVSNSIPEAGDDEVVIKLKAMALNPVDEQL
jgi:hypothetical protein